MQNIKQNNLLKKYVQFSDGIEAFERVSEKITFSKNRKP